MTDIADGDIAVDVAVPNERRVSTTFSPLSNAAIVQAEGETDCLYDMGGLATVSRLHFARLRVGDLGTARDAMHGWWEDDTQLYHIGEDDPMEISVPESRKIISRS